MRFLKDLAAFFALLAFFGVVLIWMIILSA